MLHNRNLCNQRIQRKTATKWKKHLDKGGARRKREREGLCVRVDVSKGEREKREKEREKEEWRERERQLCAIPFQMKWDSNTIISGPILGGLLCR